MKTLAFLFCLLQAGISLQFAQESTEGLVISDKVRIRESPSTNAKVVTQVDTGTVLSIVSRGEYGERLVADLPSSYWYEVKTPKGKGYVWGGFFWPVDNGPTVSREIGFVKAILGKTELALRVVAWSDNPDQGKDMPEYDDHSLVSLRGTYDEFFFIKVPAEFQKSENRMAVSSDGLLLLSGGMGGYQELTALSTRAGQLTMEVSEQTNGGQVYIINITAEQLASKNPKLGYFKVTSITVSEKH